MALEALVAAGCNTRAVSFGGTTGLHLAAQYDENAPTGRGQESVEWLISHGLAVTKYVEKLLVQKVGGLLPPPPEPAIGAGTGGSAAAQLQSVRSEMRHALSHGWGSRWRDCHSAAPPSPFGRCFNRDANGASAK